MMRTEGGLHGMAHRAPEAQSIVSPTTVAFAREVALPGAT